jgi:diguanylate cyclase (GGDEF)-like protein
VTAPRRPASAAEALALVARLLPLAAGPDPGHLRDAIEEEARGLLGVEVAEVVPEEEAEARAAAMRAAGVGVLALPLAGGRRTLLLAGAVEDAQTSDVARALAGAAAAAFVQHDRLAAERERAALREGLGEAARALQESLGIEGLLALICREAARLVNGHAALLLRREGEEVVVEGLHGLAPELVGWREPAGSGVAGRVLDGGRGVIAQQMSGAAGSPWSGVRAAIAVPVEWGERLRGVFAVVSERPDAFGQDHVDALEALADLAGVAFANAGALTGLAQMARTDPLTGCLNHAALHDGLRREVERAERAAGGTLSLILLDLERLGEGEEEHGRLVADELLRRAGHALRSTTRPYDLAARYGGAEFALVTAEADEEQACEVAARAVARLTTALDDLESGGVGSVTAGVAQWSPGMTAGDLVARADRALMYGKRSGRRGEVLTEADLPPTFAPGRGRRRARSTPPPPPPGWIPATTDALEPLRARARGLALANELGARLAALPTVAAVVAATEAALRDDFGYARAAVVAGEPEGEEDGAVPIKVVGRPWGVLRVEGEELGEANRRLLETIAAHVGAAVVGAGRLETLERACAAAADEIVWGGPAALAVAVGRRLGMEPPALRDLGLAALLDAAGARTDEVEPLGEPGSRVLEVCRAYEAVRRDRPGVGVEELGAGLDQVVVAALRAELGLTET